MAHHSVSRLLILASTAIIGAASALAQKDPGNLVLVKGGTFKNTKCTNYYGKNITIPDFYIGKYEVIQKEWTEVMGSNPSQFKGDALPVETVSWYDCVEYCNKRSAKEGLKPFYNIDRINKDPNNKTVVDEIKWTVTINAEANGYRLPTEIEWEYAASGGEMSKSYTYSGGNDIDKASWYWQNSGDTNLTGFWTWPRVRKTTIEHTRSAAGHPTNWDFMICQAMSGNGVGSGTGDLDAAGTLPKGSSAETGRVWKGGCWMGGDFCCELSFRANFEASGKGPDQGLRVCRSK